MMHQHTADQLAAELDPLLPEDELEVTAVPWANEGPRDEWIVSAWLDGDILVDVFGVRDRYLVRKPARGAQVGSAATTAEIVELIRQAAADA